MFRKLKILISEIQTRISYNLCYNKMESITSAAFGMCSGGYTEKYFKEKCTSCPYFRDIRKDEDNG